MTIVTVIENTFDEIYEAVEAAGYTGNQLERLFEYEASIVIEANGTKESESGAFGEDLAAELTDSLIAAIDQLEGDYDGCVDVRVTIEEVDVITFMICLEDKNEFEKEPEFEIETILRFLGQ